MEFSRSCTTVIQRTVQQSYCDSWTTHQTGSMCSSRIQGFPAIKSRHGPTLVRVGCPKSGMFRWPTSKTKSGSQISNYSNLSRIVSEPTRSSNLAWAGIDIDARPAGPYATSLIFCYNKITYGPIFI